MRVQRSGHGGRGKGKLEGEQAEPADRREQTIGEMRVADQTVVGALSEAAFELCCPR
jgi:hypothetical protein